jgi:hypothetical protein
MHSVVEMADLRDVEKTIELIARFVESVTAQTFFCKSGGGQEEGGKDGFMSR